MWLCGSDDVEVDSALFYSSVSLFFGFHCI